jgi:hypothetical protein
VRIATKHGQLEIFKYLIQIIDSNKIQILLINMMDAISSGHLNIIKHIVEIRPEMLTDVSAIGLFIEMSKRHDNKHITEYFLEQNRLNNIDMHYVEDRENLSNVIEKHFRK